MQIFLKILMTLWIIPTLSYAAGTGKPMSMMATRVAPRLAGIARAYSTSTSASEDRNLLREALRYGLELKNWG